MSSLATEKLQRNIQIFLDKISEKNEGQIKCPLRKTVIMNNTTN